MKRFVHQLDAGCLYADCADSVADLYLRVPFACFFRPSITAGFRPGDGQNADSQLGPLASHEDWCVRGLASPRLHFHYDGDT